MVKPIGATSDEISLLDFVWLFPQSYIDVLIMLLMIPNHSRLLPLYGLSWGSWPSFLLVLSACASWFQVILSSIHIVFMDLSWIRTRLYGFTLICIDLHAFRSNLHRLVWIDLIYVDCCAFQYVYIYVWRPGLRPGPGPGPRTGTRTRNQDQGWDWDWTLDLDRGQYRDWVWYQDWDHDWDRGGQDRDWNREQSQTRGRRIRELAMPNQRVAGAFCLKEGVPGCFWLCKFLQSPKLQ